MSTEANLQLRTDPDVVDTALDEGEIALLHLGSKMYYSLNGTGARIWSGLKQGLSVDAMCHRLEEEFGLDPEHAERSVAAFVDELLRHRLIQRC